MIALRNRLSQFSPIPDPIWAEMGRLDRQKMTFFPGEDVIKEGEPADRIFVIRRGWAIRYKMLDDGRRQIVNFMLPGDVFDLQALATLRADHTVTAVTACDITFVQQESFMSALSRSAPLAGAFWWAAVQEEAILREQIVRVGRLSAKERIGHLLLELQRRQNAGLGREQNEVGLPITRTDIADALGLTSVHVSRTMSAMRRDNLIEEENHAVRIIDRRMLAQICHFDDDYLHVRRPEKPLFQVPERS
ncbi:MAG: hypothetical protein CMK09_14335 [Ponticaulis sp.]|nr:hypothetical protein [Ponticaulis sp.]|tara:strand:- start:59057 stop:59800 length:744 start_codon:yes stop_codon:yes gene_type:complete